jgi:preprotein translocase subunit SecG
MSSFLMILVLITGIFLILLVLVQRGRGGGLAGAFGGMGGQSAFGSKAGDTFTRITIVVAAIWILLCVATVKLVDMNQNVLDGDLGSSAERPTEPGLESGSETPEAGSETPAEGLPVEGTPAESPTGESGNSDSSSSESGSAASSTPESGSGAAAPGSESNEN